MATPRALIIAIERCALIQEGLSPTLPGTHRNALAFRRWLLDVQGLAVADVFFCTEAPALEGRTSDATRKAIQQEILRLKQAGRDQTAALYVYVSGHGFSYTDVDGAPMADVLIAADYVRREDSGDACLKLDEIQKWLKLCLGPGDHYYFVDACRNQISEHEIKVATLGLTYDFSAKKKATVYTLYSTTQGTLAPAGSSFPEVLIDGLNGKGRAKTWHEGTLAVLFDSLGAYAESRLGKELDPRKAGSNDGVIREFVPPPTYTCTIGVSNAGAQDIFQVEVKNEKGQAIDAFTWRTPPRLLVSHPRFPGLFEHVGSVSAPGHQYVTVQVNQTAPLTWSTFMLPNRVTLVTVTRADRQALRVQQFMLPLKHLMSRLPAQGGLDAPVGVGADLHEVGSPLRVVRRLVEVQRAFARSGELAGVLSTAELDALLDFRWVEPVVTLLSAYELVRRGRVDVLPTLVNNLRGHFPGLPDTEALARLANLPSNVPPRPPLVLEGLQVLDLLDGRAGVPPSGQVDFRGPWSAWRAVSDPGP